MSPCHVHAVHAVRALCPHAPYTRGRTVPELGFFVHSEEPPSAVPELGIFVFGGQKSPMLNKRMHNWLRNPCNLGFSKVESNQRGFNPPSLG